MAASTDNEITQVMKIYNEHKFHFLYFDVEQQKYICINREFLLTINNKTIVAQFISTNWFQWKFDIKYDTEFMYVCVPEHLSYKVVEEIVNARDYHKLTFFVEFIIPKEKMQSYYTDLLCQNNNTMNSRIRFTQGETSRSDNIKEVALSDLNGSCRLYFDPDNDTNYEDILLMMLPSFEISKTCLDYTTIVDSLTC